MKWSGPARHDNGRVVTRTAPPELLETLDVRPRIDPDAEVRRRVRFIRDYLEASGGRRLWLAVSGGVDSAVCGRLCALAVEALNAEPGKETRPFRFIAVRLPYRRQDDEADAAEVLGWMAPGETVVVDIAPAVAALEESLPAAQLAPHSARERDFARGNTKARIRMAVQYHLANLRGGLVAGTDHAAEAVVGFFTKFGDGAADLTPLFGLTKRQVRQLARTLGAPERIVGKAPTADLEDLRPGIPDETALGLRYDEIDDYLEGLPVAAEVADRIEAIYSATAHKRRGPVTPGDRWWISCAAGDR